MAGNNKQNSTNGVNMKRASKGNRIRPGEMVQLFKELLETIEKYGETVFLWSSEKYRKLKLTFRGKTIAIIGPKAAGKSTFLKILQDGNVDIDINDYTPTQTPVEMKSLKIKYKVPLQEDNQTKSIIFKLRKPRDVGGEASYRDGEEWLSVTENVDFIFYIIDASEYKEPSMRMRVSEDLNWIAENNQHFAQNFRLVLFANQIDKLGQIEEQKAWADKNVPHLHTSCKEKLGDFENHLALAVPISLKMKRDRAGVIARALSEVSEKC